MADEHIATYLNDHLAGSVVALELLELLEAAHAGTPLQGFATELLADVAADRQELEALMGKLNIVQSRARKATAWMTEKFTELKLRLDDPAGGALRLLEALEAVAIGIDGKKALWLALAAASEETPRLRIADYGRLTKRAEDQRHRVEVVRVQAAKAAFREARG
ncbi:MAG TPA: hypothetical protein VNH22_18610 [Blastocatellia bacterium]|jgi:hypothetical protein|nr:hypothetical protein [Blastocatellia bacterium]